MALNAPYPAKFKPSEGGMVNPVKFVSVDEQVSRIGNKEWSVARLIHLSRDFPVEEVNINHLYLGYDYNITLRELVGHMEAVQCADTNYPIILSEDGEILDGRHRVMKQILRREDTIKAVRFTVNPDPCYIRN